LTEGSPGILAIGRANGISPVSHVVLFIIAALGVSVWLTALYLPGAMRAAAIDTAYRANLEVADTIRAVRDYYSKNIVRKATGVGGLSFSSNHAGDPHAIPYPATVIKDLSDLLHGEAMSLSLVSPYPWPHRVDRKMDSFESQAWTAFQTDPDAVFSREEIRDGVRTLRVAVADRMTLPTCISCHNTHPQSVKRDWKIGDVRGVFQVTRTIEPYLAAAEKRARMIIVWLAAAAAVAAVALLGATLLVERYSREKRKAIGALDHFAYHDALTDLPNRLLLQERLERALASPPEGHQAAMLFLDLDRFKEVNDACGHALGDLLLKEVAGRLRACVTENDTVARWGGDEFAIVHLSPDPRQGSADLARRIQDALKQPMLIEGRQIAIGVTIGISLARAGESDPAGLLREADVAAYHAKSHNRGRYCLFEPEMDARLWERRWIERELRRALAHAPHELEVHYQPIVDIRSGSTISMEALVRWRHPERGVIRPDHFISVAEETGLIGALGRHVLRRSCAAATTWPEHIAVSVNLSPVQFQDQNLTDNIARILADSGLPASRLELEITESVFLSRTSENLAALHRLHAAGISIALDDFGTGYSSLTYLRVFPFNKIKIDRSFVNDLSHHGDSAAIVCAVANLGRSLGMVTTAEGVETQQQLELLRAAGVMLAQGYLFGRAEAKPRFAAVAEAPYMAARDTVSAPALSATDVMLVRSSFAELLPLQHVVAEAFFGRLFEIAPQLRPMFPADLTVQKEKLMDMLATGIGRLHDLQSLTPVLRALGSRHVGYGVTGEHYGLVAEALLWTLEKGLDSAFTPEVRTAWIKVYGLLASIMQSDAPAARDIVAA
jgi:diguanylate cyclase (GGDEF)-like protein